MTAMPASNDHQQVGRRRPSASSESGVRAAIQQRARELADDAPALTTEQMVLLRAVFSHRSWGGG